MNTLCPRWCRGRVNSFFSVDFDFGDPFYHLRLLPPRFFIFFLGSTYAKFSNLILCFIMTSSYALWLPVQLSSDHSSHYLGIGPVILSPSLLQYSDVHLLSMCCHPLPESTICTVCPTLCLIHFPSNLVVHSHLQRLVQPEGITKLLP